MNHLFPKQSYSVDCKADASSLPFGFLATDGRWAEGFSDVVLLKGSFSQIGLQLSEGQGVSVHQALKAKYLT